MSEKEISRVIVKLILPIVTVVLAEGTEVANVELVNANPGSLQSPDSKKNMVEESPSRGSLRSNYSSADMGPGPSEEPSSRAIFLRPPAQLTQEDLELIDKRVEIKVTFCDQTFD